MGKRPEYRVSNGNLNLIFFRTILKKKKVILTKYTKDTVHCVKSNDIRKSVRNSHHVHSKSDKSDIHFFGLCYWP